MHFCSSCNHELKDKDLFCSHCGTPTNFQKKVYCSQCGLELQKEDLFCSQCGTPVKKQQSERSDVTTSRSMTINEIEKTPEKEVVEEYTLRPRFVFVYELLPSSFQTVILLIMLFVVGKLLCDYYHYNTIWIVALFVVLFMLKEFKIFFRKFKYRGVKYIITNDRIEYHNVSTDEHFSLSFKDVTDVKIRRTLATYLFGYGHILVLSGRRGIYLDYIAEVDQVYDYILDHVNTRN